MFAQGDSQKLEVGSCELQNISKLCMQPKLTGHVAAIAGTFTQDCLLQLLQVS